MRILLQDQVQLGIGADTDTSQQILLQVGTLGQAYRVRFLVPVATFSYQWIL